MREFEKKACIGGELKLAIGIESFQLDFKGTDIGPRIDDNFLSLEVLWSQVGYIGTRSI